MRNPLEFTYEIPDEEHVDSNRYITQAMAIFYLDPADMGPENDLIKTFDVGPEERYLKASEAASLGIRKSLPIVKESYANAIHGIQERITKVLENNLKVVLWVQLVKLYNKNLPLRSYVIGDEPLHTAYMKMKSPDTATGNRGWFTNWNAIQCANDTITFGLKASLPRFVPAPKPEEFEDLLKTMKIVDRWEPLKKRDFKEPYGREDLLDINTCFDIYEEIIDLIRTVFDQPKRDASYARLFNPIATWNISPK